MSRENIHDGHRKRMQRRFAEKGIDSFAPHEILEMVLYQVIPFKDTNALAHELLKRYGSFAAVLNAPKEELVQFKGIGEAGAVYLNMLPEFFKVYQCDFLKKSSRLSSSQDVINFVVPLLKNNVNEEVHVVCTDAQRNYISMKMIRQGSPAKVEVSVREIAQYAMNSRARGIIIAHSHPGGATQPSSADLQFTKVLYDTLMSLNIILLEHVIVSRDDFYSFFREGKIAGFKETYQSGLKAACRDTEGFRE